MKTKKFKFITVLVIAALCLSALTACATPAPSGDSTTKTSGNDAAAADEPISDEADPADSAGGSDTDDDFGSSDDKVGTNIGAFTTQDITGTEYTESLFQDHDLTLVNVFATWCTPCVQEMPDLEKLSNTMKDQNVQVVGVLLDVLDEKSEIDDEMLERANLLAEQTGVTYPLLVPDSGYMNGMLTGVEAVPYTFFVDKDGNVLGDCYGSNDLEGWTETVENYLNTVKGNQ